MTTYPTYEAAARRAEILRSAGIWPGIIREGERWRLTCDPPDARRSGHAVPRDDGSPGRKRGPGPGLP